jgi:uncharacterized protein (TIGR00251 family)
MILEVVVAPNSRKFSISAKDGRLRIALKSPPENNKANIELIRELSRHLGKPVRLLSGHSSRKKKVEIPLSDEEFVLFMKSLPSD